MLSSGVTAAVRVARRTVRRASGTGPATRPPRHLLSQGSRSTWELRPGGSALQPIDTSRDAPSSWSPVAAARQLLLPVGYPDAVAPWYLKYTVVTALGACASAAVGVLTMQSLLHAVGLGAGAVPMAAALNWVIKDGLGQLGGMAFAGFVNNRFDSNPKRWRMAAAVSLDASCCLELLTPLAPALFLPLAAVANVGKNVSWLSASATRASIHQALARQGNLGDVTAKSGSQTIASSTLGTAVGVALSSALDVTAGSPTLLLLFSTLSAVHLACVHTALATVQLPTITPYRGGTALRPYVDSDGTVPPLTVEQVARQEPVLGTAGAALWRGPPPVSPCLLLVGPPLAANQPHAHAAVAQLAATDRRYAVAVVPHSPSRLGMAVAVWFRVDAEWRHQLAALLHATKLQLLLEGAAANMDAPAACDSAAVTTLVDTADRYAAQQLDDVVAQMEAGGWWVGQLLLEHDSREDRVSVTQVPAAGGEHTK